MDKNKIILGCVVCAYEDIGVHRERPPKNSEADLSDNHLFLFYKLSNVLNVTLGGGDSNLRGKK